MQQLLKCALKVCAWFYSPFLLQAIVTNQLIDGILAIITHDFTKHHACGITVVAAAEFNVHGD